MDADLESRAAELFSAALDHPPEDRQALLDRECRADGPLRARVEELLAADAAAEGFLESPVVISSLLTGDEDPAALLVGRKLGSYQIQRIIASGGMGTVYEALQDRPRRLVALKVLKSGIASRQILRRFAHEAEILGRLQHSGIAQIYEAGLEAEAGGMPFFAMEYIPDARTITRFAHEENLSISQRLELLARVCDAVHFGHQRGVIHRDLKPGNILVDKSGRPRVIDFGVARVTDADLTLATRPTGAGQIIGTLRYMSPEQCEGDPGRVDTRCDVYALGVVLYEMLTGDLPYDLTTSSPFDVPRVIREEEPRRLSSKDGKLRGDVETIVHKALEKDCLRRYQSARGLGQDIRRYLNNEPIEARRDRKWYVLKKAVIRHRFAFGSAAVIMLVVLASAVILGLMYQKADEQRALAEARAAALQLSSYYNTIALAQNAYDEANISQLKALLGRCPESLRGWEWGYLSRLSEGAEMILDGHQGSVRTAAWSPGGSRICSGGWEDDTVRIWDAGSGALLQTMTGHTVNLSSVCFSPDGRYVLSGSYDSTIRLWDAESGEPIRTITTGSGVVTAVRFTFDGRLFVSGHEDGALRVWETAEGRMLQELPGHESRISSLALSPDGSTAASGSYDKTIRVWRLEDGRLLHHIPAHENQVTALRFSADGRRLYSGSWDQSVKVWDTATGGVMTAFPRFASEVNDLSLSPDEKTLAVAGATTIQLCDAGSGAPWRRLLGHDHSVNAVAYSPDGGRIVSCSHDGTLRIWNAATGSDPVILGTYERPVSAVACSPDGRWLASAGGDGVIRLHDAATRASGATWPGHEGGVNGLAFGPDGTELVSGGVDRVVRVWCLPNGEDPGSYPQGPQRLALEGHGDIVCAVDWSPDGALLASGSIDQTVIIWTAGTGSRAGTLDVGDAVWSIRFSPDGRSLITGGRDKALHLWDVASGERLGRLAGHTDHARAACFSPDGSRIVSCGDDWTLRVWGVESGEVLHRLTGHRHFVLAAAFSPDGRRIVSASYDKTLKVWDPHSGHLALTLRGHEWPVNTVCFTPDGRRIISGSADATIRVWDAGRAERR